MKAADCREGSLRLFCVKSDSCKRFTE